jgi:phosphoglycerate-specific signal transduction histidine kinase
MKSVPDDAPRFETTSILLSSFRHAVRVDLDSCIGYLAMAARAVEKENKESARDHLDRIEELLLTIAKRVETFRLVPIVDSIDESRLDPEART